MTRWVVWFLHFSKCTSSSVPLYFQSSAAGTDVEHVYSHSVRHYFGECSAPQNRMMYRVEPETDMWVYENEQPHASKPPLLGAVGSTQVHSSQSYTVDMQWHSRRMVQPTNCNKQWWAVSGFLCSCPLQYFAPECIVFHLLNPIFLRLAHMELHSHGISSFVFPVDLS